MISYVEEPRKCDFCDTEKIRCIVVVPKAPLNSFSICKECLLNLVEELDTAFIQKINEYQINRRK